MKQYQQLLQHILDNGNPHSDRTGVSAISFFGYQSRYNLREGFPVVTTNRVPFRWVAEEFFGFYPTMRMGKTYGRTKRTRKNSDAKKVISVRFTDICGEVSAAIILK